MGCGHFRTDAPSPDIQTIKASAHHLYRASVRPDVTPIPVRRLQTWTLHLDTIDGQYRHEEGLPAERIFAGSDDIAALFSHTSDDLAERVCGHVEPALHRLKSLGPGRRLT